VSPVSAFIAEGSAVTVFRPRRLNAHATEPARL